MSLKTIFSVWVPAMTLYAFLVPFGKIVNYFVNDYI